MPINIVTEAIEKENMRYQRELKIAALAISAYASRLDKKLEYYKICSVSQRKTTNYIPTLVKSFVIWFLTDSHRKNTCKCVDRSFGVFKECTNKSKCKELSCVDQLAALQVET